MRSSNIRPNFWGEILQSSILLLILSIKILNSHYVDDYENVVDPYRGTAGPVELGVINVTCHHCEGHYEHHTQKCVTMQDDVTDIVFSPTGYCSIVAVINQTGSVPKDGEILELNRDAAYTLDALKVNTTGVSCQSTIWQGMDPISRMPAQDPLLKCIWTCFGDKCNNSTSPLEDMRKEALKNRCYSLTCGTNYGVSMEDCDLNIASNTSGHGSCYSSTTYDGNTGLVDQNLRGVNALGQNLQPTFGQCIHNAEGDVCYQNCIGDLCNADELSNSAVCITCQSTIGSIDFIACLESNEYYSELVRLCPKSEPFCVTRQGWDINNNTITIEKGCSVNRTTDFFTNHHIPFNRECWYVDNNSNNVTYVCSQLYDARGDKPVNDHRLTLGNFQVNPTTPSAAIVHQVTVIFKMLFVVYIFCFWKIEILLMR